MTKTLTMELEYVRIPLDRNSRMLRLGVGRHDGRWFIRVDLWAVGYRLSTK